MKADLAEEYLGEARKLSKVVEGTSAVNRASLPLKKDKRRRKKIGPKRSPEKKDRKKESKQTGPKAWDKMQMDLGVPARDVTKDTSDTVVRLRKKGKGRE